LIITPLIFFDRAYSNIDRTVYARHSTVREHVCGRTDIVAGRRAVRTVHPIFVARGADAAWRFFVAFVQTLVFTLLSMIYLSEVSHAPHDDHELCS